MNANEPNLRTVVLRRARRLVVKYIQVIHGESHLKLQLRSLDDSCANTLFFNEVTTYKIHIKHIEQFSTKL